METLLRLVDPDVKERDAYGREKTSERRPDPILALALRGILDWIQAALDRHVGSRIAEEKELFDAEKLRRIFRARGWSIDVGEEEGVIDVFAELGATWEDWNG